MTQRRTSTICAILAATMVVSPGIAWRLSPRVMTTQTQQGFAHVVPQEFGDWKETSSSIVQVDPDVQRDGKRSTNDPYDDVLMRAYTNSKGEVVLLTLAYGRYQRQEVKIHRPELCYLAQGFQLVARAKAVMPLQSGVGKPVNGERMLVQSADRVEVVSFWLRVGSEFSDSSWNTRVHILKEGLRGRVPDGILVRASQIVPSAEQATPARYAVQEQFLKELLHAVPLPARDQLVGARV